MKSCEAIIERIQRSEVFEEYMEAFENATGLPLEITEVANVKFALCSKTHGSNKFCKLMSGSGYQCDSCKQLNYEIVDSLGPEFQSISFRLKPSIGLVSKTPETVSSIETNFWKKGPRTFECFAGMCESMVPIYTDNEIVGFLKTGQVLLHQPTREAFRNAVDKILELEPDQDKSILEQTYFSTPVLSPEKYEAMVLLLKTFSIQLTTLAHNFKVEIDHEDPVVVQNAKRVMQERYCEPLILDEIAKCVSISPFHLSREFKKSTGLGVLEYLRFIRIEHAKDLLLKHDLGIAEVAFQVGFGSLAPFNKAFKKMIGLTPHEYRKRQ